VRHLFYTTVADILVGMTVQKRGGGDEGLVVAASAEADYLRRTVAGVTLLR
jgi:hypothetical protein